MLRDKYGISYDRPMLFKHKPRESNTWKGIMWSSDVLRPWLRRRVTNGKKAIFWFDRWVGESTFLEQQSIRQVEEDEVLSTVDEYRQEGNGWKRNRLAKKFNRPLY